jgi:hypothetical protein
VLKGVGTHFIGIHDIDSFNIALVMPVLDLGPRHVSKGLTTKPVGLATDVLRDIVPIDFALPKIPSPILAYFAKGIGLIYTTATNVALDNQFRGVTRGLVGDGHGHRASWMLMTLS